MEKVKKERKPRQPKTAKASTKTKTTKPKEKKTRTSSLNQLQNKLVGNNNLMNEDWFKQSLLKDIKIVENETTKKLKKVRENSKLSAEKKQKQIDNIVAKNTKLLINLTNDYKKNPEFYKSMYYRKK